MAKVFVSYSRKDIEFAKRLTAELQKCDLDFWIDWEGIPPTVDWWKEIEKGIEEADIYLFLISPDSIKSKVCGQEIDTAVKNGKRIIPIVVRDSNWDDTPSQLRHLNYIFLRESDDFNAAVNYLFTAIQTDYEWAATHRRMQVKALEWERNKKENSFLLRGKDLQEAELELATNSSKEPHPTDLQHEYLFTSRKDATQRQRMILAGVCTALVISLILVVIAFLQRQKALYQAKVSRSQTLAVNTQLNKDKTTLNLLLGVASLNLVKDFPYRDRAVAEQALRDSLAVTREGFDLIGHQSWISAIAFSPNGNWLATASDAVRLWDLANPSAEPTALQERASALAFSPDGQWLAGTSDNKIVVWNLGNPLARPAFLNYDEGTEVSNLSFSPDGQWLVYQLVSTSLSNTYLWNTGDTFTGPDVFEMEWTPKFSPDGQKLATVSFDVDGYFLLRDLKDLLSEPIILREQREEIDILSFSPDGNWIATTNFDNVIKVWNLNDTDAKPSVLPAYQGYISILTFSPDNRWLVAGDSNEIRFWETHNLSREPIFILDTSEDPINSLAFSPNNQWLAIGSSINAVQILDTNNLSLKPMLLPGHTRSVKLVAFSFDGQWLATASADNTARLWKMKDPLTEPVMLRRYDENYNSMATSFDGKWLASGNKNVRLWDLTKRSDEPVLLPGYKGNVSFLSFSPDGRWLATGGSLLADTIHVAIWDVTKSESDPYILEGAFTVDFSPDSQWMASRNCRSKAKNGGKCENGELYLLDLSNLSSQARLMESYEKSIGNVVFSSDGNWLATWDNNEILIWEIRNMSGKPVTLENDGSITTLAFSPDSQWLASGSCKNKTEDGNSCEKMELYRWDLRNFSAQPLLINNNQNHIYGAVFSSNSRWLAARDSYDILIWDMKHLTDKPMTLTSDGAITTFAFSPDSQLLAGGSDDRTMRVWKLNDLLANPMILRGHESTIYELAFSPDGHWLASGVLDNLDEGKSSIVRLWNTEDLSAAPIFLKFQHVIDDEVSITFSPDNQSIITGTNPIRIWRLPHKSLLASGCEIAGRNFTRAEWKQYFSGDAYPTDPKDATCPQWPLDPEAPITQTPTP